MIDETTLLPCPFHKEKAMPYLETGYDEGNGHPESGGYWAAIECPYCNIEITTLEHSTEEQAIEAVTKDWNTRYEHTCKHEIDQVPEGGPVYATCTNCGWQTDTDYIPMPNGFNYCPNCGAKVIEE